MVEEEAPGSGSEEDLDFDFDFDFRPRSDSEAVVAEVVAAPRSMSVASLPRRTFAGLVLVFVRFVRWAKAKRPARCCSDFRGELKPSKFQISEIEGPIDAIPSCETAIVPSYDDGDSAVRTSVVRGV